MKIKRVNKNWFIGKLPGAAFFGQSVGEVSMKANDWRELSAVASKPVERKRPSLRLVS